jgi:hypothetical protein
LLIGVILGTAFAISASVKRHVYAISALVALMLVASAVAARQPNRFAPHLYAAAHAFDSGEKEIAVKEIDVVLQIAPDDLSTNRIASEIFLNEPDYPPAESAIRKVLMAKNALRSAETSSQQPPEQPPIPSQGPHNVPSSPATS